MISHITNSTSNKEKESGKSEKAERGEARKGLFVVGGGLIVLKSKAAEILLKEVREKSGKPPSAQMGSTITGSGKTIRIEFTRLKEKGKEEETEGSFVGGGGSVLSCPLIGRRAERIKKRRSNNLKREEKTKVRH